MFKNAIIVGLGLKLGFIIGGWIKDFEKISSRIIIRKIEKSDSDGWQDAYETVFEKPHPVRLKKVQDRYRKLDGMYNPIGFKVED